MDYFGDKIENKQSRDVLFNIVDKVSGYDIYDFISRMWIVK